jgi:hypothetical protein
MVKVRILSRIEFTDRTDPFKPIEKVMITYLTDTGILGTVSIPKKEWSEKKEQEVIKAELEKRKIGGIAEFEVK